MGQDRKVIFLDRDGAINIDHGYVHTVDAWELIPGVPAALKKLKDRGYALAVITNQSGIGHGLYATADMQIVHDHMLAQLAALGVAIDVIAFCPHRRDQTECDCRKPKTGMLRQIEAIIPQIDYANSWTIGDKIVDMEFGKNAGTKTALIRSAYWNDQRLSVRPDMIVDSLAEFAERMEDEI